MPCTWLADTCAFWSMKATTTITVSKIIHIQYRLNIIIKLLTKSCTLQRRNTINIKLHKCSAMLYMYTMLTDCKTLKNFAPNQTHTLHEAAASRVSEMTARFATAAKFLSAQVKLITGQLRLNFCHWITATTSTNRVWRRTQHVTGRSDNQMHWQM